MSELLSKKKKLCLNYLVFIHKPYFLSTVYDIIFTINVYFLFVIFVFSIFL